MNKVKSVNIKTHFSDNLDLNLISEKYDKSKPFYTVLTGRNGSYKSTVLKEIASYAILGENELSDSKNVDFHIEDAKQFKVIAHSGATIDRYPLKNNNGKSVLNLNHYTYLGQKAGSNIVSRRQPYETMLSEALAEEKTERIHSSHFYKCFNRLNLMPGIKFVFYLTPLRNILSEFPSLYDWVYASSQSLGDEKMRWRLVDKELAKHLLNNFTKDDFYELQNLRGQKKVIDFSKHGIYRTASGDRKTIRLGLMLDVLNVKQAEIYSLYTKKGFSLYDLSTGEFNNLTSILGLLFAVEKNSIVLVDEPEVSLHPQWQVEFIDMISDIFKDYEVSHVIISTHSPMIVSSVAENSLIIDLSRDGEYSKETNSLYGASTDEILINHFGLATGRNFFVMDTLQKAVKLIEDGKENTSDFKGLISELEKIQSLLSLNDPMIEVIKTVISYAD